MAVNVGPVLRQVLGEARGNEMLTWAHWRRGTLPFLTWRGKCKAGQGGREGEDREGGNVRVGRGGVEDW